MAYPNKCANIFLRLRKYDSATNMLLVPDHCQVWIPLLIMQKSDQMQHVAVRVVFFDHPRSDVESAA